MTEAAYTDIRKALADLHRWVLENNGLIISADHGGQLGFSAYTEPVETEKSFLVTITVRDAKASFEAMPESLFKDNLRFFISKPGGRKFLASLLSTSNGWHQLVRTKVTAEQAEKILSE